MMLKKGIGISCAFQGTNFHFGHHDVSRVLLEVSDDNFFALHTAASDVGQGLEASLLTIVSDSFGGLPVERIRWTWPSTRYPDGGTTGASRQTTMTGNALYNACLGLKQVLSSVAAEMMDVPPKSIEFAGEFIIGGSDRKTSLSEVLEQARKEGRKLQILGEFVAPPTTPIDERGKGDPINQFGYATCVAEVEVDTETGEVKVISISAYHDSGRILNLTGAEAQVEGGVVMGLGYATTEDFMMEGGKAVNVGFTNYLIPTVHDSPASAINVHFVENFVPMGKLRVKGLAEIPNTVIAPAITNAIFNATGARVIRLPATPERVFLAIQEAEHGHEQYTRTSD
jgi:CO/xanthine dehydrogenase Mo-binding subunit